jgi:4-hydroxy-3-polyprenylbenzoate decarboxylase
MIDATLKHDMPPLALPAEEYMTRAKDIWQELGLPRIVPQAPWHGYQLGDWEPEYAAFAKAAVAGDWRQSGDNTYGRRHGNLIPETPVRSVEKPNPKPTRD